MGHNDGIYLQILSDKRLFINWSVWRNNHNLVEGHTCSLYTKKKAIHETDEGKRVTQTMLKNKIYDDTNLLWIYPYGTDKSKIQRAFKTKKVTRSSWYKIKGMMLVYQKIFIRWMRYNGRIQKKSLERI